MREIVTAFRIGPVLSIHEMHEFQDDLKTITEESLESLIQEIIETGMAFAPDVYLDPRDGLWKIVDAHNRKRALIVIEDRGYTVPKFQTIEVLARDYQEAKRRVLQRNAQYGKMTAKGLIDFGRTAGLTKFEQFTPFRFADVNTPSFKAEFFTEKVRMPELRSDERQPFQQITITLHDSQAELVKKAMALAKDIAPFTDGLNENSNGNAMARICESYLSRHADSKGN